MKERWGWCAEVMGWGVRVCACVCACRSCCSFSVGACLCVTRRTSILKAVIWVGESDRQTLRCVTCRYYTANFDQPETRAVLCHPFRHPHWHQHLEASVWLMLSDIWRLDKQFDRALVTSDILVCIHSRVFGVSSFSLDFISRHIMTNKQCYHMISVYIFL